MSPINRVVLALATFVILGLAANPASAQIVNPGFETGNFAGYTPLPTACGSVVTNLAGNFFPTQGNFFAVLNNSGIRQCNLIQGDVASDGFVVPANALPGTHLLLDLAFFTNEIGTGASFNDTAAVFLTVADTGQKIPVAFFSRNQLQPGGAGPLRPFVVTNRGGFAASTNWVHYYVNVFPFAGQRVFLTFYVRNALDTAVNSALAVDNLRLINSIGLAPIPAAALLPEELEPDIPVRPEPEPEN